MYVLYCLYVEEFGSSNSVVYCANSADPLTSVTVITMRNRRNAEMTSKYLCNNGCQLKNMIFLNGTTWFKLKLVKTRMAWSYQRIWVDSWTPKQNCIFCLLILKRQTEQKMEQCGQERSEWLETQNLVKEVIKTHQLWSITSDDCQSCNYVGIL